MAEDPGSEEAGVWGTMNWQWIGYALMAVLFALIYRCFRVFFAFLLKLYRRTLAWVNPKYKRRLALLHWIEKRTEQKLDGFWELWENPEILSNVVNGVIPVAYIEDPGFELNRHATLQQIQALVSRYFDVRPMFLGEELKRPWTKKVENKFIRLLHLIKASIEKLEQTTRQEDAGEYVARGMGLIAATKGHPAAFFLYSRHELDFDSMHISITGPGADTSQITITGTRDNAHTHDNHFRIRYEVIENAGSLQDGVQKCLRVTYTPNHVGEYKLDITKHGYIILGSPFIITVEDSKRSTVQNNLTLKPETRVINRVVDFVNEKMLLTDKGELIKITSDPSEALAKLKTQMDEQSAVAISLAKILQKEARPTPEVFFEVCEYIMKTCHFILQNSSCTKGLRLVSSANKLISGDSLLLDDGVRTEVAHTEREMKKLLQSRAEQATALQSERRTKRLFQARITKPPQSNEASEDPDVIFLDKLLSEDSEISRSRCERRREFGRISPKNISTTFESLEDDVFTDSRGVLALKRPLSTENFLRPDMIVNRSQLNTPDIVYVNLLETEENVTCRKIDTSVTSAPKSLDGCLSSEHSVIKAKEFFRYNRDLKDKVVLNLETNFFKSVEESLTTDESSSLSETERRADSGSFSNKSTILFDNVKPDDEKLSAAYHADKKAEDTTNSKTLPSTKSNIWVQGTRNDITQKIEVKTIKTAKITLKKQERVPDENSSQTENAFLKQKSSDGPESLQKFETLRTDEDTCSTKSEGIESIEMTKANISVRKIICDFEKMLQAQNEQVETIIKTILDHPVDKSLVPTKKACIFEEINVQKDSNNVLAKNVILSLVSPAEPKIESNEITQPVKNKNDSSKIPVPYEVLANESNEEDAKISRDTIAKKKLLLQSLLISTAQSKDCFEAENNVNMGSMQDTIEEKPKSDASLLQENDCLTVQAEVLDGEASLSDRDSHKDGNFLSEQAENSEMGHRVETSSIGETDKGGDSFQAELLKTVVAPFKSLEHDSTRKEKGGVKEEILEIGKTLVEALMKHPMQRDVVKSVIKQISIDKKLSAESVHMFLSSFEESGNEISPGTGGAISEITTDAVSTHTKESTAHKIDGEEERKNKKAQKSNTKESKLQTENSCGALNLHAEGNGALDFQLEKNLIVHSNYESPQNIKNNFQELTEGENVDSICVGGFSEASDTDRVENNCFESEVNPRLNMENELPSEVQISPSLEHFPAVNTETLKEENNEKDQNTASISDLDSQTKLTQSEITEKKITDVPFKSNEPQCTVEKHFTAIQDKKREYDRLDFIPDKKVDNDTTLMSPESTKLISDEPDLPDSTSQSEIPCSTKSTSNERDCNLIMVNDKANVEAMAKRTLNYNEKVEEDESWREKTSNEISLSRAEGAVDQDSLLSLKLYEINTAEDVSFLKDRDIVNEKSSEPDLINNSSLNYPVENTEGSAANHVRNMCRRFQKEVDFKNLDSNFDESVPPELEPCQTHFASEEIQTIMSDKDSTVSAKLLNLQDENAVGYVTIDTSSESDEVLIASFIGTSHCLAKNSDVDQSIEQDNVKEEINQGSESQNCLITSELEENIDQFSNEDINLTEYEVKHERLDEKESVLDSPITKVTTQSEDLSELTKLASMDESNVTSKSVDSLEINEDEKLKFFINTETEDTNKESDGADSLIHFASEKSDGIWDSADNADAVTNLTKEVDDPDTICDKESGEDLSVFTVLPDVVMRETDQNFGSPDLENTNDFVGTTEEESTKKVAISTISTDIVEETIAGLCVSDLVKTNNINGNITRQSGKAQTGSEVLTDVALEEVDVSVRVSDLVKTDKSEELMTEGSDKAHSVAKDLTDFSPIEVSSVSDSEETVKIVDLSDASRTHIHVVPESHKIAIEHQSYVEITHVDLIETPKSSCNKKLLAIVPAEQNSNTGLTVSTANASIELSNEAQKSQNSPQDIDMSTKFTPTPSNFSQGDEVFSAKENIKCKLCSDQPSSNIVLNSREETEIIPNARITCKLCLKQTHFERSIDNAGSVIDFISEIGVEGANILPDVHSKENQRKLSDVHTDLIFNTLDSKSRTNEADETNIPKRQSRESQHRSKDLVDPFTCDTLINPTESNIEDQMKKSEETKADAINQSLNVVGEETFPEVPENQKDTEDSSCLYSEKIKLLSEKSISSADEMSIVERGQTTLLVSATNRTPKPTFEGDEIVVAMTKPIFFSTDEISDSHQESMFQNFSSAVVSPSEDTILKSDDQIEDPSRLVSEATLVPCSTILPATEETILKGDDIINDRSFALTGETRMSQSVMAADVIVQGYGTVRKSLKPLLEETSDLCLAAVEPTKETITEIDDKTNEISYPVQSEKLAVSSAVAAPFEDSILHTDVKINEPLRNLTEEILATCLAVKDPIEDTILKCDEETEKPSISLLEETLAPRSAIPALVEPLILKIDDKTDKASNSLPKDLMTPILEAETTTEENIMQDDDKVTVSPSPLAEEPLKPHLAVMDLFGDTNVKNDIINFKSLSLFHEERPEQCSMMATSADEIIFKTDSIDFTEEMQSLYLEGSILQCSAEIAPAEDDIMKKAYNNDGSLEPPPEKALVPRLEEIAHTEEKMFMSDDKTNEPISPHLEENYIPCTIAAATSELLSLNTDDNTNQFSNSLEISTEESNEKIKTEPIVDNGSPFSDLTVPLEDSALEGTTLSGSTGNGTVNVTNQLTEEQTSNEYLFLNDEEILKTAISMETEVSALPSSDPLLECNALVLSKNETHLFEGNINSMEPTHELQKPTLKMAGNSYENILNLNDESRVIKSESFNENDTGISETKKIERKASTNEYEQLKEELSTTKDEQSGVQHEFMSHEEICDSVKTEADLESNEQILPEQSTVSTINDMTDANESTESVIHEIRKLQNKVNGVEGRNSSFLSSTYSLEVMADLMETRQSLIEIETDLKNGMNLNVNEEELIGEDGFHNEVHSNILSEELLPEVDENNSTQNETTSKLMQSIVNENETGLALKEENTEDNMLIDSNWAESNSTERGIHAEPVPDNTNDSNLAKDDSAIIVNELNGLGDTFDVVHHESVPREEEETLVENGSKVTDNKPFFSIPDQPDSWFSEAGGECFAEFHSDSLLNNSWLEMKADDLLIWSPSIEAPSESCSDSIQVSKELDFESIISAPNLDAALRKLEQKINSAQQVGSTAVDDINILSSNEEDSKLSPVIISSVPNTTSDENIQEFVAFGSNEPLFDWKTIGAMGPAEREIWGLPAIAENDTIRLIPGLCTRGSRPNSPSMGTITESLEEQEDELPKMRLVPRKYSAEELPIITLTPEQSFGDVVKEPLLTDECRLLSPLHDSKFREDLKILSVLDYMNLSPENTPVCHVDDYENYVDTPEDKFPVDISATTLGVAGHTCLGSETDDDSEVVSESELISAALLETIGFPDPSRSDKSIGGTVTMRHSSEVDTSFNTSVEDRLNFTEQLDFNQSVKASYEGAKLILSSALEFPTVDTELEERKENQWRLTEHEYLPEEPEQLTKAKLTLPPAERPIQKTKFDIMDESSTTEIDNPINSEATNLRESEDVCNDKVDVNQTDRKETDKTAEPSKETLVISDKDSSLDRIDFKEIRQTIDSFENLSTYKKPKISLMDEIKQIGTRGIEDRIRQFNEVNKAKSRVKANILAKEKDTEEESILDLSSKVEESCACELLKKDIQNASSKTNIVKEEKDKINEHIAAHDRDARNSGSKLVAFWKNYWDKVVEENQTKTDPSTKSRRRNVAKKSRMTITLPITRHELPVVKEEENGDDYVNYALSEESIEHIKQLNIVDRIRLFEGIVAAMTLERSKSPTRTEDRCRAPTPDFSSCEKESDKNKILDYHEIEIEDMDDTCAKTDDEVECQEITGFQNGPCRVSVPDSFESERMLIEDNILDPMNKEMKESCSEKDDSSQKEFEFQRDKCFQNKFVKLKEYFELLERQSTVKPKTTKTETSCTSCHLEKQLQLECKRRRRKRKSSRRQLAKGVIQSAPTSDSETPAQQSYQLWGSERLRVSERIHIKELFEDVFNETGWFRGAVPNRKAVLASLRSIDTSPDISQSVEDDEEDALNIELESIRNISNVPRGYQNVYPYIPTTPIHQYRSRPCAEHNLIPRNTLLQLLDED